MVNSEMSHSKSVLFVVNKAAFFLSHRKLLAMHAKNNGYAIHVATPFDNDVQKIIENGFVYHSIYMSRSGVNPFQELHSFYSLYSLYRRLQPDLVHHITIKPVLYGTISARLARIPAVVNAIPGLGHVFTETGMKSFIRRQLVIFAYRQALRHRNMKVIFQNTDNYEQFLKKHLVTESNAMLIKGSGVDIKEYCPVAEPTDGLPLIILASRMLYDKGVEQFVEAARYINCDKMVARFALVGDSDPGNPNAVPTSQLSSWNEDGVIEWWGFCENMPEILRQTNIVCLPTYYGEGVPKILIEAAASGRPIVTTDIAGCREIVKDGLNGFLVREKDVTGLVESILNLINNPELRKKMSDNGRNLVIDKFTSEIVNRRTISIYQELLTK